MKKTKGQTAPLDIILCMLLITTLATILYTLPEGSLKNTLTNKNQNQYTQSLLTSVMHTQTEDKSTPELITIYFTNNTLINKTYIKKELTQTINSYLKNKQWLLYARKNKTEMKIPTGKENIEGKALSSASIKLKTPDRDEITIYLWIKWQTP